MTKVFISYSTKDEVIAQQLYTALHQVGAEPFLSSISIKPGANSTDEVFKNLNMAKWAFFIATKSSCSSPFVQQELGALLTQNKQIIPILKDMTPEELPGWVDKHQAIDVRKDAERLQKIIEDIGQSVKEDKILFGLILGVIVALLLK